MLKYYTRVCNFYSGQKSKEKVKEGLALPISNNNLLSFDTIEIRKFVDIGYQRARKVLTEKIDDLHKLAKALLTYETLTGPEIEDLISKGIYPANKEDLKVEEDKETSALGSIGLKPKIVH